MAGSRVMIVFAMVASVAMVASAATSHVVGGSMGWTIPSSSSLYSQWALSQTFAVGDTLLFNFTTGMHNVIEVPKSSYDSCSSNNQLGSPLTTGPATVTIKTSGNHYFICGVTGHCSIGQKLAITVPASTVSAAPVPAPVISASAPTASSPAPATAPTASSPAPTTSSAPAPTTVANAPTVSAPTASLTPSGTLAGPTASSTPTASLTPSGTLAGPTASSTENPTAVGGPSDGGPSPSSAPSGILKSSAMAVLLSAATVAFLVY